MMATMAIKTPKATGDTDTAATEKERAAALVGDALQQGNTHKAPNKFKSMGKDTRPAFAAKTPKGGKATR